MELLTSPFYACMQFIVQEVPNQSEHVYASFLWHPYAVPGPGG